MPEDYHIFWLSPLYHSFNSSCHHSPTKHKNSPSRRCSMRFSPLCSPTSRLSSGCWVLSIVALLSTSHLLKSCKHHRVHCTSFQLENIPCWALQTRNYFCYFSLGFFFPIFFYFFEIQWICHCISKPFLHLFHLPSPDFCLDSCLQNHFMMLLLSDFCFFHYPFTKEKRIYW